MHVDRLLLHLTWSQYKELIFSHRYQCILNSIFSLESNIPTEIALLRCEIKLLVETFCAFIAITLGINYRWSRITQRVCSLTLIKGKSWLVSIPCIAWVEAIVFDSKHGATQIKLEWSALSILTRLACCQKATTIRDGWSLRLQLLFC